MKNRKTENSIREEVMKSKPDNLDGILRQCGKQEDIISVKRARGTKKTGWLKTACCIAAALVLMAVGVFAANGIISKTLDGVKILGRGELNKKLTVKVAKMSASAKEKIEKAGGKAEVM